jgi:hypothetical protein
MAYRHLDPHVGSQSRDFPLFQSSPTEGGRHGLYGNLPLPLRAQDEQGKLRRILALLPRQPLSSKVYHGRKDDSG